MPQRHPLHDQVAKAIHWGFTSSFPLMGYTVERRPFGFFQRHTAGFGALTVDGVRPADVQALLADARAFYGETPFGIYIDGPALDATLAPALVAAGCVRGAVQIHLAHTGTLPDVRPVAGVLLEEMTEATVAEWCVTKLKGFANSEEEPNPARVSFESAIRRAEAAGAGRFHLGRDGSAAASIIGVYDAEVVTIFLLATRVPFRNRGIARWLLSHTVADAYARGRRAITISCDPEDTPIRLYQRLGFTDEVHWRRRYELPGG